MPVAHCLVCTAQLCPTAHVTLVPTPSSDSLSLGSKVPRAHLNAGCFRSVFSVTSPHSSDQLSSPNSPTKSSLPFSLLSSLGCLRPESPSSGLHTVRVCGHGSLYPHPVTKGKEGHCSQRRAMSSPFVAGPSLGGGSWRARAESVLTLPCGRSTRSC